MLILAGFWLVAANYPTAQELQSSVGQFGRFVSEDLQRRYENAMTATYGGGFLIVVGFLAAIIGAAWASPQPVSPPATPKPEVGGIGGLTPLERRIMTLCPECQAPIPRAATRCSSCNNLLDETKVSKQQTIQEMIDAGKIRDVPAWTTQAPAPRLEAERGEVLRRIEKVFCYYCGEPMPLDAVFCRRCGKKQEHPTA